MKTNDRPPTSNGHDHNGHSSNRPESLVNGLLRSPISRVTVPARSRDPLRDITRIVVQYRVRGAVFFCLSLALVVAGLLLWPRKYTSDAKLLVRVGRSSVTLDPTVTIGQVVGLETRRENEINSALELLNSRSVLEGLLDAVGTEKPLKTPLDRERALIELSEDIEAWSPKRTDVIAMAYEAKSPERARAVVQKLVEIFLAEHLRVNSAPRSLQFFEEQAAKLKKDLNEASQSLRTAKERFSLSSIEGQRKILETQISAIGKESIDTETGLSSSRARSNAWHRTLADLPEPVVKQFVKGLPADAENNMREQLFALQTREQELAAKLTEVHPQLIAVRRQVRMVEELLKAEQPDRRQAISAVVLDEHVEEEGLVARRQAIAAQRESLAGQQSRLNAQEVQIVDLSREVELLDAKYRTYVQSMEQARIDRELEKQQITNISVIQPPSYIVKPTSPKRAMTLLAGLAFSAVGSLALILISDQLNSSFKSVSEVEESLGEPVLVTLPQRCERAARQKPRRSLGSTRRNGNGNRSPSVSSASGATGECFHSLLHGCRWPEMGATQQLRTVGFTSCFAGEGASSFAVNCAIAAASTGDRKVLLVDENWNHPTLHETFDVSQSPGVAEFLRGTDCPLEIQKTNYPHLSVLAAGDRSSDPFTDYGSPDRLQALLETLTDRFDLVVFDLASVGNSNAAMPLLTCVDGVVLVMEMNRVPRDAALRVTQRLKRAGVRLLGVALNKHENHMPRWLASTTT